jgi:hypothetical protein
LNEERRRASLPAGLDSYSKRRGARRALCNANCGDL